ncbi:MAG: hypothetical protein JXL97_02120 [Bacteroidales bacterium]|nr:hypothetical protein [Bacteroidales bacterium]
MRNAKLLFIFAITVSILFSCSSNSKKQKKLLKKTESFSELALPSTFYSDFFQDVDFHKIDDESFISEYLVENYSADETEFYGGKRYALNDEIEVIIWATTTTIEEVLWLATYKKDKQIDVINIAGNTNSYYYSCEISHNLEITITSYESIDGVEYETVSAYSLREDGEIIEMSKTENITSLENMKELFVDVSLPYYSNEEILYKQMPLLTLDELQYFINNSSDFDLFDQNFTYYANSKIDFGNDLYGYTFMMTPTDGDKNLIYPREKIFFEYEGVFISAYDLWSGKREANIEAKIFANGSKIFLQYDKTEYLIKQGYFIPDFFSIETYLLNDEPIYKDAIGLSDVYDKSSFDFFYNSSKIGGVFSLKTFKKFGKISEDDMWEMYENNAEVKAVGYFKADYHTSGFIFHIKDGMQNTFVYNKFNDQGDLLEYKILEDCISATCADFEVKKLFYDNKPVYNIQSRHAAGGFLMNIYVFWDGKTIKRIYASEEEFMECPGEDYCPYFYTLIDDDELEGLLTNYNIEEILGNLQGTDSENDVLKMNIETLEKYVD